MHQPPTGLPSTRLVFLLLFFALLTLVCAPPHITANTASAQSETPAAYQATLDQVRALMSRPEMLQIQRTPTGGRFVDRHGSYQCILLARTDAQGDLITRCVGSVEDAAAFLSGSPPLSAEPVSPAEVAMHRIAEDFPALSRAALDAQATITINVRDNPGEGFYDPTPASPVGGNTGTTVGAQRLIAFQHTANIWANAIQSTVPIIIDGNFDEFGCNILGMATPQTFHSDFTPIGRHPGPAYAHTWYVEALANKRAGYDLSPVTSDIGVTFNSAFGSPGCASGGGWYYGLDSQEPSGDADLVAVLLHEIAHGLGFISLVGSTPGTYGQNFPYASDPAQNQDDVWNHFLYDTGSDKLFDAMTVAERARAITSTNALVWSGPAVTAAASSYLAPPPVLTITSPPAASGRYAVGSATFGPQVQNPPLVGALVAATDTDSDGSGTGDTAFDACSPLTNAGTIAGAIALIDRGTCAFTLKARHAQDAGAIAAIIANNQPGSAPVIGGSDATISIPTASISQADGITLRGALASYTVSAQLGLDHGRQAGTDSAGRVLMYAPSPVQSGSSVSHFDPSASPNLLMEPSINPDLGQDLDLTDDLLRDIGWYPDRNANGVSDMDELDLALLLSAAPTQNLRPGSAVTITLSMSSSGLLGASSARLVDRFPADLGAISWSASYSGGASGPTSGSGDIDLTLVMPSGSSASFTVHATVMREALSITNSASITSGGVEIDMTPTNNQSSVTFSLASNILFLPFVVR